MIAMCRNRIMYFCYIVLTIGLGLFSRTQIIPELIYPYLGDTLYAILVFLIVGFLWPNTSSLYVMYIAVLLCYGIEVLQCYDADWINSIRDTSIGKLVLGQGFLWSDLLCYTVGGSIGMGIEQWSWSKNHRIPIKF